MTELPRNRPNRLQFGPLLRVLSPSLVTLVLVVLLVFTMFFTEFDRQWVTFLAGILFASVLALVSASLKSGWRAARRYPNAVPDRSVDIGIGRRARRSVVRRGRRGAS